MAGRVRCWGCRPQRHHWISEIKPGVSMVSTGWTVGGERCLESGRVDWGSEYSIDSVSLREAPSPSWAICIREVDLVVSLKPHPDLLLCHLFIDLSFPRPVIAERCRIQGPVLQGMTAQDRELWEPCAGHAVTELCFSLSFWLQEPQLCQTPDSGPNPSSEPS